MFLDEGAQLWSQNTTTVVGFKHWDWLSVLISFFLYSWRSALETAACSFWFLEGLVPHVTSNLCWLAVAACYLWYSNFGLLLKWRKRIYIPVKQYECYMNFWSCSQTTFLGKCNIAFLPLATQEDKTLIRLAYLMTSIQDHYLYHHHHSHYY